MLLLAILCLVSGSTCNSTKNDQPSGETELTVPLIQFTSPAFEDGANIPKQYTGDGADQSPPLRLTEADAGTRAARGEAPAEDGPAIHCEWLILRDLRQEPGGELVVWIRFQRARIACVGVCGAAHLL